MNSQGRPSHRRRNWSSANICIYIARRTTEKRLKSILIRRRAPHSRLFVNFKRENFSFTIALALRLKNVCITLRLVQHGSSVSRVGIYFTSSADIKKIRIYIKCLLRRWRRRNNYTMRTVGQSRFQVHRRAYMSLYVCVRVADGPLRDASFGPDIIHTHSLARPCNYSKCSKISQFHRPNC